MATRTINNSTTPNGVMQRIIQSQPNTCFTKSLSNLVIGKLGGASDPDTGRGFYIRFECNNFYGIE